jgi:hypothetical protein
MLNDEEEVIISHPKAFYISELRVRGLEKPTVYKTVYYR